MKESDFPLVRGGKIPKEALRWLTEVERVFPSATKDIIIVHHEPISSSSARDEAGNTQARGGHQDERST
jgi:hypothetical protein